MFNADEILLKDQIKYKWMAAKELLEINEGLSRSYISDILTQLKENEVEIPNYFRKLFCFKCFNIFDIGVNCNVFVNLDKNDKETVLMNYKCLNCKHIQCVKSKKTKEEMNKRRQSADTLNRSKDNKRRKLLTSSLKD